MPHKVLLAVVVALLVSGCNMTTPSQLRTGHIQIEKTAAAYDYDLSLVTDKQLHSFAREYERVGRGPLTATVSYDAGQQNGMAYAKRETERVLTSLRRHGIQHTDVHYVAAPDRDAVNKIVLAYPAVTARAPDHCTRLPGYQGAESLSEIQTYQISCESKDVMSRMIVRPEDLLGTDGRNSATSRRAGAIVESYQDGEPNENFYEIKSASEVAN